MYLVHYDPTTHQVLGYLDPSMGIFTDDDGTAYFSISDEAYAQYSTAKAWTDGKVITNIKPPNDFAVLTDDGWVIDEELEQQALKHAKTQAKDSINNAVILIYSKFNPLRDEYTLREQQAQAFAEAGYAGDVPPQIQAVAEPTGMTAQQATESILNQAQKMHQALEQLGKLRMQKLAVKTMETLEQVQQHEQIVLGKVAKIAEEL